ncbi:MAG TPA: PEP-CTERM-box response regulator transcription factor [Verrucomicrobiae bacterium]|jgi:two-component system NtrC family response regulator
MRPKILIVDDDEEIRTQMKWGLAQDNDIVLAEDRATAVEAFQANHPHVVLLDLGLPPNPAAPEEGLATLSDILSLERLAKVIVITGQGEKTVALRAIGTGAYDFLVKPADMDELKLVVRRAVHIAALEIEFREMQQLLSGSAFEGMMGTSAAIRAVFEAIRKVATTDAPVLLLGESGTGKEMAARAIHQSSSRKNGPFIAINCSAIPETLLESELFGHEKGSFTGAHAQRKGKFEMANAGTLFLDEIGEIPLPLQVKLLRFLAEQRIERVGGRQPIEIDARVVTATNADLRKGMTSGTFREDLFYRLSVVVLTLPPLRDRDEDIRMLAQYFLQRFAAQSNKTGMAMDQDALRALDRHSWPGNVRELENCIRRAVIMADGKRLTVKDLELEQRRGGAMTNLKDARENLEREMINAALRKFGGKIAPAAVELGVSRPTLYDLMDKYGIAKE